MRRSMRSPAFSDNRDFYAVDWRERVKQAFPFLAAVAPNPELSSRGAQVERRRPQLVDVHGIAQHGEVTLPFWQPFRELLPRVAAVLAAPDSRSGAWTGACRGFQRHHIDGVRALRMHHDRETEIGRQSLCNRAPRVAVVVAAQDTNARPRPTRPIPFGPAAVVLHVTAAGRV